PGGPSDSPAHVRLSSRVERRRAAPLATQGRPRSGRRPVRSAHRRCARERAPPRVPAAADRPARAYRSVAGGLARAHRRRSRHRWTRGDARTGTVTGTRGARGARGLARGGARSSRAKYRRGVAIAFAPMARRKGRQTLTPFATAPYPAARKGGGASPSCPTLRPVVSMSAVQKPVRRELERVQTHLRELFRTPIPILNQVGGHVLATRGKKFRPTLLLLTARLRGHLGQDAVLCATVVEMVHAAALIHDDSVDRSHLRRG